MLYELKYILQFWDSWAKGERGTNPGSCSCWPSLADRQRSGLRGQWEEMFYSPETRKPECFSGCRSLAHRHWSGLRDQPCLAIHGQWEEMFKRSQTRRPECFSGGSALLNSRLTDDRRHHWHDQELAQKVRHPAGGHRGRGRPTGHRHLLPPSWR